jgi:Leucine-rich repeat (LRR) protein
MNKLDSLPNSIGDLASLKKLGLGNNEVYHVSPRIGQLKNLQVLEMWSNNVHYLPIEAGEMSNLMELDLRNIQMNQDHQNAIKAIFDSADLQIKFSMSCNCQ